MKVATDLQTANGQEAPVKVTVVKPAAIPAAPESPQPVKNLLLALVLGLGLGLGLALLRDGGEGQVNTPVGLDAVTPQGAAHPPPGRGISRRGGSTKGRRVVAASADQPSGKACRP